MQAWYGSLFLYWAGGKIFSVVFGSDILLSPYMCQGLLLISMAHRSHRASQNVKGEDCCVDLMELLTYLSSSKPDLFILYFIWGLQGLLPYCIVPFEYEYRSANSTPSIGRIRRLVRLPLCLSPIRKKNSQCLRWLIPLTNFGIFLHFEAVVRKTVMQKLVLFASSDFKQPFGDFCSWIVDGRESILGNAHHWGLEMLAIGRVNV